jgi:hypothetical protein
VLSALYQSAVPENRYSESASLAIPSLVDYPLVAANAQMLSQKASTSKTFTNPISILRAYPKSQERL